MKVRSLGKVVVEERGWERYVFSGMYVHLGLLEQFDLENKALLPEDAVS